MSDLPRVLITGFEPFGGERLNPAWEVAQALAGRVLAGDTPANAARLVAEPLPCAFATAPAALAQALARHQPALVLCLGQAGGRCDFTLERVALNLIDARIPDNAGAQPVDEPVLPGGPDGLFTTLPVKAMVAALRAAGLPASVSHTAGTFVCNQVFYGLMHQLRGQPGRGAVRGGFMHLPWLPEQAARHPGQPSLPLATQVAAVEVALQAAWATRDDVRRSEGSEH